MMSNNLFLKTSKMYNDDSVRFSPKRKREIEGKVRNTAVVPRCSRKKDQFT